MLSYTIRDLSSLPDPLGFHKLEFEYNGKRINGTFSIEALEDLLMAFSENEVVDMLFEVVKVEGKTSGLKADEKLVIRELVKELHNKIRQREDYEPK